MALDKTRPGSRLFSVLQTSTQVPFSYASCDIIAFKDQTTTSNLFPSRPVRLGRCLEQTSNDTLLGLVYLLGFHISINQTKKIGNG